MSINKTAACLLLMVAATCSAAETPLPHAFEAGWKGQRVCEIIEENRQHRIARCTFPPGVGHEWHYHRPHSGYALSAGTMRIETDDGIEEVEIPAGISWSSDSLTRHQALNIGDTTTSYLIIEPLTSDPPKDKP